MLLHGWCCVQRKAQQVCATRVIFGARRDGRQRDGRRKAVVVPKLIRLLLSGQLARGVAPPQVVALPAATWACCCLRAVGAPACLGGSLQLLGLWGLLLWHPHPVVV